MPLETTNREGRYEVRLRPSAGAGRRAAMAAAGVALCLTPLVHLPGAVVASLPELLGAQAILLLAAFRLLASASRRSSVVASLHVATGEVEIVRGRGPLARTVAFGSVEVDRFLLARSGAADRAACDLLLVPRSGAPVPVLGSVEDEAAALDAGITLSRGMDVPLDDRRWPEAPDPAGGESAPPSRVARIPDGARRIYAWDYRDRFRPLASLLALGTAAAIATAMPALAAAGRWLVAVPALLLLAIGLGLATHALRTLATRRVILRPDAVRIERHLGSIPLGSRLLLYGELKAVLLLARGPLATVSVRTTAGRRGGSLPLEDAQVAGWLRNILLRAAHDAGRRKTHLAG